MPPFTIADSILVLDVGVHTFAFHTLQICLFHFLNCGMILYVRDNWYPTIYWKFCRSKMPSCFAVYWIGFTCNYFTQFLHICVQMFGRHPMRPFTQDNTRFPCVSSTFIISGDVSCWNPTLIMFHFLRYSWKMATHTIDNHDVPKQFLKNSHTANYDLQ